MIGKVVRRFRDRLSKAAFRRRQYPRLTALKCVVAYNRHGGYCVPESSRHRPAAQRILTSDVYEPDTIAFIASHCGAGDVVHAGTYFGDFLPALSRACQGTVWAFEPNLENYRCARITLELNGIENVTLTHAGLGARREHLPIVTEDGTGRALGGASRIMAGGNGTAVQMVTVDEVVGGRRVSVLQLDVEGHEREALTGALGTIRRDRPIVILETVPRDEAWFREHILALGYRETQQVHGNAVLVCR